MELRVWRLVAVVLSVLVLGRAPLASAAPPGPITVLITNDDGVAAPGINALVTELATNPNLNLIVIAPATNQSGTGDQTSAMSITSTSTTTAGGYPAIAVAGFPADSVVLALRELLPVMPDLVVSGINSGQNLGGLTFLSGTVGAALWSARLGVPAFAVSQSFIPPLAPPTDYSQSARYMYNLVEKFRTSKGFRKKMRETDGSNHGLVLNVNFPTCTAGTTQGVRVLPRILGTYITSFNLVSSMGGTDTWQQVSTSNNPFGVDCTLGPQFPNSDVQGLNFGYATVTPMSATGAATSWKPKHFKFAEKIKFLPPS